jgi:hypothetical protein
MSDAHATIVAVQFDWFATLTGFPEESYGIGRRRGAASPLLDIELLKRELDTKRRLSMMAPRNSAEVRRRARGFTSGGVAWFCAAYDGGTTRTYSSRERTSVFVGVEIST